MSKAMSTLFHENKFLWGNKLNLPLVGEISIGEDGSIDIPSEHHEILLGLGIGIVDSLTPTTVDKPQVVVQPTPAVIGKSISEALKQRLPFSEEEMSAVVEFIDTLRSGVSTTTKLSPPVTPDTILPPNTEDTKVNDALPSESQEIIQRRTELSLLRVVDLHSLLEQASIPVADYKSLKKEDLVEFVIEKLFS